MSLAPNQNAIAQRLLTTLVAETQQVREFISILEEERDTLARQEVEQLYALAEQKARQARLLQQYADNRAALLAQARLPNDRDGVEKLIGGAGNQIWHTYLEAVREARTLNEANGRHITERLTFTHQALAVLMAHTDQPATYGPDGTSRPRPGSRLLGSY